MSKAYGAHRVVDDFSAIVNRGEKIVLVGRNGVGQDDDAEGAAGRLRRTCRPRRATVDDGKVRWGHEVSIGYFAQDHTGAIEQGWTAVDWLHQFDPDASRQDIHGLLGQMLFSGEEGAEADRRRSRAAKPRGCSSAASCCRSPTCSSSTSRPTTSTSKSINALNIALQKFDGTVLLVTHDQDLMEEVGTRVWHFDHEGVHDFKGTFEEFEASVPSR